MHAISDSECSSDEDVSILSRASRALKSGHASGGRISASTAMPSAAAAGRSRPDQPPPAAAAAAATIAEAAAAAAAGGRPVCQYGAACYRKNPEHLEQYQHPDKSRAPAASEQRVEAESQPPPAKRCRSEDAAESDLELRQQRAAIIDEACSAFDFYLSSVRVDPSARREWTSAGSMSLNEILSMPVGELLESVQFNYMFELDWLVEQYPAKWRHLPLLLVHGMQREAKVALQQQAESYPNIKLCQARLEMVYGTHHTKMMLLLYDVGLRIVITTANLIEQDWDQKTQGIWLSPLLPVGADDSPTNFKKDLLEYLDSYKAPLLQPWIDRLRRHDASAVRVFLVASVPGRHRAERKSLFGHLKLRKLLQEHARFGSAAAISGSSPASSGNAASAALPSSSSAAVVPAAAASWPVIGQFSSVGSLGSAADQWLCKEWLTSMAAIKRSGGGHAASAALPAPPQRLPSLRLVYPTVENVRTSFEGYLAGGSLPYASETARKQPYLVSFMCQWRADSRGRTDASPHIKSYARVSPDHSQMSWFLLTSANLSKAAWGALEKQESQLMIRSYELGVLFVPSLFTGSETFDINGSSRSGSSFPLPYDLPLTPYSKSDSPWIVDLAHAETPDRHGRVWKPR